MKRFTYLFPFVQRLGQMPVRLALLAFLLGQANSPCAQTFLGLTSGGGADGVGAIVQYDNATNTLSAVASFPLATPGKYPVAPLVELGGKLYGMTNEYAVWAIFEWDPTTNTFTQKVAFDGTENGKEPTGSLTPFGGKLYGMTSKGGTNNLGVIFEWDPATNTYTKKVDFNWTNGALPNGSLTLYGGKFYGMTSRGGTNGDGVIFEWDPATNTYTPKIDFDGTAKGAHPNGSLTLYGDKLFGMTQNGGTNDFGVIFKWDPATNTFSKKVNFNGIQKGARPAGNLTLAKGKFYGMTLIGGSNGQGVLFEWNPVTNTFIKKMEFDGTEKGRRPAGSLTQCGGKLYGMAPYGGTSDFGVIFEWDPVSNTYTKKVDFDGSEKGYRPTASLTLYGGKLYGMTGAGGTNGLGVIFEWVPATNTFTKQVDFGFAPKGATPTGSLTESGGKYYGMTMEGGTSGNGVIFEWDPGTNTLAQKVEFDWTNGALPTGNLSLYGDKFYGITSKGGTSDHGVIFEWDPATGTYTKKAEFDGTNGKYPTGNLNLYGGKFYGMTGAGGTSGDGVIFEWDPATNTLTKQVDFDGSAKGYIPAASLTLYGGKLYGMTEYGGTYNHGVIFEWDPATNTYTKKVEFNWTNGTGPNGSLTLYGDKFYGMTYQGGANNHGVIFEWDPATNTYTKKVEFNWTNGARPNGSLTLYGGKFYGMTCQGGANNLGVIFEWDPVTNTYTKKADFDGTNGAKPLGDLTVVSSPNAISDPLSASGLVAWPNPATHRLMVQVPAGNELLTLTDHAGRTVRSAALNGAATTLPLDLSGLAAGVYTLRAGTAAIRVVKE